MDEKLVYRSHFQPAPRRKSSSAKDTEYALPAMRRGSPYRSSSRSTKQLIRTILRILIVLLGLLLLDRVSNWRGSDWYARWIAGKGVIKTTREWREPYDAMELGLTGLPLSFRLASGDEIPSVGLGTWKASSDDVVRAVTAALESGYRHIDGAWIYNNEAAVGSALQAMAHRVPRESIFITSKLWNTFHNPEDIEPTLDETLRMLQTEYIDLYLIHWPVAQTPTGGGTNVINWELTERPIKTWLKLEELVRAGKIRNIGVSNFNVRRLQNLTTSPEMTIKPVVNQVELNYWNPQPELLAWSKANNVLLEAYSPLGGDGMVSKTLKLPVVQKIAKKLHITPAQVIISWHVQRGTVVLPKSIDPGRISENYQLFTLPHDLFKELEDAATAHRPHRLSDPSAHWGLDIFEDDKDDESESH